MAHRASNGMPPLGALVGESLHLYKRKLGNNRGRVVRGVRQLFQRKRDTNKRANSYLGTVFFLLTLLHPSVATTVMLLFNCEMMYYDKDGAQEWLQQGLTVECAGPKWIVGVALAVVTTVVYLIGLPLFGIFLFMRNARTYGKCRIWRRDAFQHRDWMLRHTFCVHSGLRTSDETLEHATTEGVVMVMNTDFGTAECDKCGPYIDTMIQSALLIRQQVEASDTAKAEDAELPDALRADYKLSVKEADGDPSLSETFVQPADPCPCDEEGEILAPESYAAQVGGGHEMQVQIYMKPDKGDDGVVTYVPVTWLGSEPVHRVHPTTKNLPHATLTLRNSSIPPTDLFLGRRVSAAGGLIYWASASAQHSPAVPAPGQQEPMTPARYLGGVAVIFARNAGICPFTAPPLQTFELPACTSAAGLRSQRQGTELHGVTQTGGVVVIENILGQEMAISYALFIAVVALRMNDRHETMFGYLLIIFQVGVLFASVKLAIPVVRDLKEKLHERLSKHAWISEYIEPRKRSSSVFLSMCPTKICVENLEEERVNEKNDQVCTKNAHIKQFWEAYEDPDRSQQNAK
ncbi:hypothetical protein CYMTET_43949 [Cymbomonas tetramitiformis]|uniref:Uncharacterized protein n=1 Tax=Cymbomonas tetramitiformis TaxID=36881 RepID=A0AAE0C2V0_9CHLO|nr:hypothetical protein CYMTET_43949 [Cymbomonas tetramitiformis]